MANVKPLVWVLIKSLAFGAVLYAGFRFMGDFSPQQSGVLTFVVWVGYGLYEAVNSSRRVENVFSPFCVSVHPNWYELLSDFKLIHAKEEWHRLYGAANDTSDGNYAVFRHGFAFTVIRPPADDGLLPGLTFWDNRKRFLAEVELSEPIIEIEGKLLRQEKEHPFFHHPRWSSLPRLSFKWGSGGYEIGLEVQNDWWEQLRRDGTLGDLAKIKEHKDHLCGTTRLVIAKLPYSELGLYYRANDYGQVKKQRELMDKELEANGWKRKLEEDSEIRDPWSRVEHKYFAVSHRSI